MSTRSVLFFSGLIDHDHVYATALSAEEIDALMQ